MTKNSILSELDRWIVGKGDGKYIEYDYNPYTSFLNHTLNEEKGIQQVREELEELISVLLKNRKLNRCLEIGLGFFGSTHFLFRQMFSTTITIEQNFERIRLFGRNTKAYYNKFVLSDGKSKFYHGISNAVDTVTNVYKNENEIDFLFIDGNHSYEQVLADYLMYSPLVKRGGIIAFHDTIFVKNFNEAVPNLMKEIENGKYTNGDKIEIKNIHKSKTQGITYFYKQ
jgi:predicted O-methyltransferase YrrM